MGRDEEGRGEEGRRRRKEEEKEEEEEEEEGCINLFTVLHVPCNTHRYNKFLLAGCRMLTEMTEMNLTALKTDIGTFARIHSMPFTKPS